MDNSKNQLKFSNRNSFLCYIFQFLGTSLFTSIEIHSFDLSFTKAIKKIHL